MQLQREFFAAQSIICLRLNIRVNNYGFRQVVLNSPARTAVNSGGLIPPNGRRRSALALDTEVRHSGHNVSVEMWGYSASLSDAGAQSRVAGLSASASAR